MSAPHRTGRPLTDGEVALARGMFGDQIDYARVRMINRKWAFFQPRDTVMAPRGSIHFHPRGCRYCDDFCTAAHDAQGLLIHEMTHVWQHQRGINLLLRRLPFARYGYEIEAGKPFDAYSIEQQAEIVRHAFLMREGWQIAGKPPRDVYDRLLPFAR